MYKNDNQILSKTQRKTPKKALEKYQNISEEKKDKRRKKVRDKY